MDEQGLRGRLTEYSERIRPSGIRALEFMASRSKDLITFGPGRPDDGCFPVERIREAYASIFGTPAAASDALQYAPTEGSLALRSWLVRREQALGRRCELDNVLITSGSQQAIHLITRLLAGPGREVLVQAPTYSGALQVFHANGADIRRLDAQPEPSSRPAFIYAMADFQNPTGACLTLEERHALIERARRLDTILVEDNAYEMLRFEGDPLPSLMDVDGGSPDDGRTVHLGSFSKCAAPGLRLGWVVGPRALVARLALIKQTEDLQASTLSQNVMAHLADFVFDRHVSALRQNYRMRRDLTLDALERHVGTKARWERPAGGFFIWLQLAEGIDATALLSKAIEAGVAYVPGASFFPDGSGSNTLRLSYSAVRPDRLEEGIARLGALL